MNRKATSRSAASLSVIAILLASTLLFSAAGAAAPQFGFVNTVQKFFGFMPTGTSAPLGQTAEPSERVFFATRLVTTSGTDSGNCTSAACATITYAIGQAVAGDTISIAAGTYTELGIIVDKQNLTFNGAGASSTIIQANANPDTASDRVFTINFGITALFSNLVIANGKANEGGGMYINQSADVDLSNVVVRDNYATNVGGAGGGIQNFGGLVITNSTFSGNRATAGSGGGVANSGTSDSVSILNSTFTGNIAAGGGGAVYGAGGVSSVAVVLSSTFSGNSAGFSGAGLYIDTGIAQVTSATIANNQITSGTADGAGVARVGGTVTLSNTIVATNLKNGGASGDVSGTIQSSSSFNLIGTCNSCGLTNGVNNNQVGVANAFLGTLANNGGPTMTHALLHGSTAVDKGSAFGSTTDQRGSGFNRTFNDPAKSNPGDGTDIGAYEAQAVIPPIVYTFNGTTNTDWATASNWSTGVVPTTANLITGDSVVIAANCVMNDVVITFPSDTSLTVNSSRSLSPSLNTFITINSGATLTVNASGSISQGRITNAGTMDIFGSYTAFHMTNNSGGVLNIKSGGSYSCPSCAETMNAGSFINNDGTMNTGTPSTWQSTVNNNATGVITDGGNGSQLTFGASSTVNNAGSLVSRTAKSAGIFNNLSGGQLSMPATCNFTILNGGAFTNGGTITIGNSDNFFNINSTGTLTNNAAIKGVGTLAQSGTLTNSATASIAPGLSPGKLTVTGNLDLGSATYTAEINGPVQGTGYDWIAVSGNATLTNASLVVDWGAFTPSAGQTFNVMTFGSRTGTFSTVTIPPISGLAFNTSYSGTAVTITVFGTQYRTRQTGNWNDFNTWEVSTDGGASWINAVSGQTPTSASSTVTIGNHTVTVTANVTVDEVTGNPGGSIQVNNGVTLTVADGAGTDLTISSGGQLDLFGSGALLNNGQVQIDGQLTRFSASSSVTGAPSYGTSATIYYAASGIGRTDEWLPNVTSGAGYPKHVTLQSGSLNLPNGVTNQPFQMGGDLTVTGGFSMGAMTSALTVVGNVHVNPGASNNLQLSTAAGGDLNVGGNFTVVGAGSLTPNGRPVTFNGTGNQLITTGGTGAGHTFAGFTVNKASGTATLAGDLSASTLNVTAGTFDQGATFTVSSGAATVGGSGTWTNSGSGDLTLSGNVSNAGSIAFDGGGPGACGADAISISSSVNGTQRAWSGAGSFSMTDIDVRDQAGSATIIVLSGTNNLTTNGANWLFVPVCAAGSYTWTGTAGTDWAVAGNWTPTRSTPNSADILYIDGSVTPAPTITNVGGASGETVAALNVTNSAQPNLSASTSAKTVTLAGTSGAALNIDSTSIITLSGSTPLTISVATGSTASIGGGVILGGGAHRLIGADANAVTFASGGFCTTTTGFTGNAFGDGSGGNGAAGSVRFQSGANYFHSAGSSPFGNAANPAVAVFQTGSTASFFTATGFESGGRTYADLVIGRTDPGGVAVAASGSGTGDFQFDNLSINSPAGSNSSLTHNGSGTGIVRIQGNITSNGAGSGTLPDVVISTGSNGIAINKQGGGTITFGNDGSNTRGVQFENDTTVVTGTTLALNRVVLLGLSQPNAKVLQVNAADGMTGGANGYVIGNIRQFFLSAGAHTRTFNVGTANGYSPVDTTMTVSSAGMNSLTVGAVQAVQPNVTGANAIARYWKLSSSFIGTGSADLTFNYLQGDVAPATEADLRLFKYAGAFTQVAATYNNAANTATVTGVSSFSDWTLAEPSSVSLPPTVAVDAGSKLFIARYITGNFIARANVDGTGLSTTHFALPNNAIGVTVDTVNGKLYWSSLGSLSIGRMNLDGSGAEPNFLTGVQAIGMEVDTVNGWLYMAGGAIRRVRLDGTGLETLIAGLDIPGNTSCGSVALDVPNNKLYYGFNLHVGRADLDGTNHTQNYIATGGGAATDGLAIDRTNGKLYWATTGGNKIGRANVNGTSIESTFLSVTAPRSLIVDPQASKVFWSDGSGVGRANLDGTGVNSSFLTVSGSWGIAVGDVDVEGTQATRTGTYNDVDGNPVTISVSSGPGSVTQTGTTSGTWTWTYTPPDGPASPNVTISATDSLTAASSTSFVVNVNNVAPTIALTGNSNVVVNATYTLNLGAITDPGTDTVTGYSINWGDGNTDNFPANHPTGDSPTHTYTTSGSKTITVSLTDEDGTHGGAGTKTITVLPPPPVVTAVNPTSGSTLGGNIVTITGANFTGVTGVTFGGTAATGVTFNNDTEISVTAPAHAAGAVSVEVTTPSGTSSPNTLYTYVGPTITAVPVIRPAGAGASNSTIANVTDPVDPLNTLSVTVNGGSSATQNGVTVNNISVSAAGVVTADVAATSVASDASFTLTVTNSGSATATATLPVIVSSACPVTGTFLEDAEIAGPSPAGGDRFGTDVAIDGDTAVVGAPWEEDLPGNNEGRAHVYVKSGGVWAFQQTLLGPGASDGEFGSSVAVSGDTIAVGAPQFHGGNGANAGTVDIYKRTSTTWSLQQRLTAPDAAANDNFGSSISIIGDTVVIGARNDDTPLGADGGSAYVFTRSGTVWTHQQKLLPSDGMGNYRFGNSVAISGDTVLVSGAHSYPYVFVRSSNIWTQQQKLNMQFADSVAISGDTVVVGDYHPTTLNGFARVFVRASGIWTQQQDLSPVSGSVADLFGLEVSISGDTIAVGAQYTDLPGETQAGAAYLFQRSGGSWTEKQRVTASDASGGKHFGTDVAIAGGDLIVGSEEGGGPGSAYIFRNYCPPNISSVPVVSTAGAGSFNFAIATVSDQVDPASSLTVTINGGASAMQNGVTVTNISVAGTGVVTADVSAALGSSDASFALTVTNTRSQTAVATLAVIVLSPCPETGVWTQQSRISAGDAASSDQFGISVAINGTTAIVGAHFDDTSAGADAGSAYVFTMDGAGLWTQQQKLTASDGASLDAFGWSVSVSGDTAIVGAYEDGTTAGVQAGSAYVFTRSGNVWTEQQKLTASDAQPGDNFGYSVAINADTVAVGADLDDHPFISNAGSAYIFTRTGSVWTERQKLTAPDAATQDQFGSSVAISGNTVAVGASLDDTAGGTDAGSVYIFVQSGFVWSQQQHIFASDGAGDDRFGISIGASGDSLVVGAPQDDNAGGTDAGSAYVLTRNGAGVWSQQQKLTASDAAGSDFFGGSVAISGDTVIAGSSLDDTATGGSNAGSAYMFRRSSGVWSQSQKLTASDGAISDSFGSSVAVSGELSIVGAYLANNLGGSDAGSAYMFSRICPAPAEIDVRGNGVSISDGDSTPIVADNTDVGSASVPGGSAVGTYTVHNLGAVDLNLTGSPLVAVGGVNAAEFSVSLLPASPIGGGGFTSFQVTFSPTAPGLRTATLSIANNDSDENPYNFAIQGTGTVAETSVAVSGGNLTITDDNGGTSNDNLTISCSPPDIIITDPSNTLIAGPGATQVNANTVSIPIVNITGSITVNTLGGNDSLTLNLSGCDFIPAGGVFFNGGTQSGSPGDSLTVTGGSTSTITHTMSSPSDGTIALSGPISGVVTYTGLEPVTDNMSAVDRVFTFTGGAETITLSDPAIAGMTMIDSTLSESITFANPTGSLTVNPGTGSDIVNVTGLGSGFNAHLNIYGDSSNGFTQLGTFDYTNDGLGNPGNQIDANPNGELVYLGGGFGASYNDFRRVNASNPAAMTSDITSSNGAGIAVNPVTGRFAGTNGGSTLSVFNENGSAYDTEGITGCGGSIAAGNGTFGIGTQCSDRFMLYNEAGSALTFTSGALGVGSNVLYNPGTGYYYFSRNPGQTFYLNEAVPATNGVLATSPYFLAANGVTNRLYASAGNNVNIWDGSTPTAPTMTGTIAVGSAVQDYAVNTLRDRIYVATGNQIRAYTGDGATSFGTVFTLPAGFTLQRMEMAAGSDRLYVTSNNGTQSRLFALDANGDSSAADADTINFNAAIALPTGKNLNTTGETINLPNGTSDVSTLGTGTITMTAGRNIAMLSGSTITTVDGAVTLNANQQALPTAGEFYGVGMTGARVDSTGTGNIVINGRGGNSGTASGAVGVAVDPGSAVTTNSGSISIVGVGGNTNGEGLNGIQVHNGSLVESTNAGAISLTGTAGTNGLGSGQNHIGIRILSTGTVRTTGAGQITLNGTGGTAGSADNNHGVRIENNGAVTSTGNGTISLLATGGANVSPAFFTNTGTNRIGFNGTNPFSGSISIEADSMSITNAAISTTGSVSLRQRTALRPIVLGGADLSTQLGLTDAEIDLITAGTLNIGDANSGAITTSGGVSISLTDAPVIPILNLATSANVVGNISGNDISVATLNITAPTGIGALGNSIDIDVSTITTNTSGLNGDQHIVEANTATVGAGDMNAGTGTIRLVGRFNTASGGDILSDVLVRSGGTLGGVGSVSTTESTTIESGGAIAPGTSPGILNTGSVTFGSGSTFAVEIGGNMPGNAATDHDQLNVTGTVSPNGATLSLAQFNSFVPTVGQTFVIINNDLSEAITTTFNGLPENATIPSFLGSTLGARITYAGGTNSNDVVLAACSIDPVVTTIGDTGPGSLRQAVIDACPGSTITFAGAGVINLSSGQITIDKNLTIQGLGAGVTVVNNTQAAGTTSRVFVVNSGVAATLNAMTISGGNVTGANGGGIYSDGTLNINNSTISGNTTTGTFGGGLLVNSGSATLTGATVSGNTGPNGGGIAIQSGSLIVGSSSILGNNSLNGTGGAISIDAASVSITNTTIGASGQPNRAVNGGAVILRVATSSFTMNGGSISFNQALGNATVKSAFGGGIYAPIGVVDVDNVDITNNTATRFDTTATDGGGALYRPNTTAAVSVNLSRFIANTSSTGNGNAILDAASSTANFENNWWGCDGSPGSGGCDSNVDIGGGTSIDVSPRIDLRLAAVPTSISPGGTSTLTADVIKNSDGNDVNGGNAPSVLVGKNLTFAGGAIGSINAPLTVAIPVSGSVVKTFTATSGASGCGTAMPSVALDNGNQPVSISIPCADLSITKTDSQDPVTVDNNLTYTITVTNGGPVNASNVQVTDTIPANTTFVSSAASQGSCSGTSTVTCSLGTINNAASATVQIVVTPTAPAAGTTISNTATATATEFDPTTPNSATATTDVVAAVCTAPPSGLVASYKAEGNANDSEGPVFENGSLQNGATFASGKSGQAFSLDGVNDFVQVPNSAAIDLTTAGSQSAWVRFNQTPSAAGHTMQIVGQGSNGRDFDLQAETDNKFVFYIETGTIGSKFARSTTVVQTGVWYHVVGTWDSSGIRIYVNGVLEEANTNANALNLTRIPSGQPLQIGNQPVFGPRMFSGLIDETEIFSRALSATEVADRFNGASASGMTAWYKGENDASDQFGLNNGSLQGGTTFTGGKTGQGFNLDGTDDFVDVPDHPGNSITGAITVDAWIKPDTLTGSGPGRGILSKYDGNTGQASYLLFLTPSGDLEWAVYQTVGPTTFVRYLIMPSPPIAPGVFTHIAATFDPATQQIKLYINGVDQLLPLGGGSTTISSINDSTAPFRVGAFFEAGINNNGFFDGIIDEIQIFNRALSSADIAAIYNASTAGKCVAPEVVVEEPVSTDLTDNISTSNFGSTIVGQAGTIKTYTVRNRGTTTLNVGAITIDGANPGDFVLNTSGMSPTIAPNGNTAFTVQFMPSAGGVRTANLHIPSDDADENPFDVALTGTGLVPGTLSFKTAPYTDSETNADHTFTVTVQRTIGSDGIVGVTYATSAGTATAGADYTETTNTLSWGNGDTADKTFNVTVKGDTVYEANETVNLTLSAATGSATIGTPNPTTLTITNDDAVPATVVVNTTADTDDGFCLPLGQGNGCTLREAMDDANQNGDATTVNFGIPNTDPGFAGGVYTIQPTAALPMVSTAMTINGPSQTTFGGDTNANGPEVVVNGSLSGGGLTAFHLTGTAIKIVQGLVVNGYGAGGAAFGGAASNYQILDNYVGTNASGTAAVANNGGLGLGAGSGNMVSGNLISGNTAYGISTCDVNNSTFTNNKIGTDRTGTSGVGNGAEGFSINCINGNNNTISSNTIAFNGTDGLRDAPDYPTTQHFNNKFTQNSIFSNGEQGIDLWPGPGDGNNDGVTANDNLDVDAGANNLQNFPVITAAYVSGSTRAIRGTLNTTASSAAGYTVEFFANAACDSPGGNGEGQTYLGSITTSVTNASGDVTPFVFNPATLTVGQFITATATDSLGNTSEFSQCFAVTTGVAGTIEFALDPYSVAENAGPAVITVTRTGGTQGAVTATFDTSNGTATSGSDYTAVTGFVVSFADGVGGNQTINVPLLNDGVFENDETVNLSLSNTTVTLPNGESFTAPSADSAVLTITNDEACVTNPVVTINADSGVTSLRQAVLEACAGSTITFAAGPIPGEEESPEAPSVTSPISLSTGQIVIDKNVTITGPGASLLTVQNTQAQSPTSRIFTVSSGVTATVSGLTITGGNTSTAHGGAINNDGTLTLTNTVVTGNNSGSTTAYGGGGIANQGTLNLNTSTVSNNTAMGGGGGLLMINGGTTNITGSTFSGNTGNSSGAILAQSITPGGLPGTLTVANSTISGNTAIPGTPCGGIWVLGTLSTANITSTTITNNTGTFAGGICGSGGTATVRNSIIAGNVNNSTVPDVDNTFTSQGYNLIGNVGTAVGFTQPTDQTGTGASVLDPRIAPLANNGGPTSTHALCVAAGVPHASCAGVSPAIDKGDDGSVAPTTDQRGAVRPFDNPLISPAAGGDNSDIGAYEVNNSPPTIVAVPTSRNAGSAVSNSTIANVTDAESGNGGVTVTVNGGATATVNGVTVSNIQNNGTGGITADVVAACGATNASFTLTATDGGSLTATATLNVTVVVVPPTLSYNTPAAIVFGAGTTVNPATGPSDNGSVASIAVQNASSYTGTVSVHNTTGVVTFSNAGPVGTHAIIIRITDNCGTTTDASFNLTVNKADTLTQITGDTPDPSIIGQAYAVTWTVTPVSPGAGTPTGNVTVTDGTGGTCTAPVAAGTCNVTSTSAGVKTLVATYSGDASFNGSTSPGVSHTVNLQITGTIRQYPAMTGLANVTVRLLQMPGATTLATTTTNASGVYTFAGVFAGNVAVVPDTTTPAPGRQYDPLSRSYNAIVNNITGADFTAYNSLSDVPRTLNLTTQYVVPGAAGTMPVILNSQDNEAQVSFTIIYDINPFAQPPTFVCGTNAPGCTLTTDTSVLGRVGVTITPAGGAFSMADGVPEAGTPEIPQTPGPKEIARMNFQTLANNLPSTPINFTATPVNTIARDAANNPLLLNAINGLIVFAQGNESDVSTRNAGNGTIDSTDVVQIRRFVTGLDTPVANFNEFQRADVAPAASRGNGQIDATDVIQTRRYATGLDAPQSAAGPGAANPGPVAPPVEEAGTAAVGSRSSSREIRLGSSNAATNSRVAIPVEIIANGDEMAMSFTVRYDHTKLGDPTVQTANTPDGATLTTNTDEPGVIRVLLDAATPFARSNTKDANTIFNIAFDVSAKAPTGDTTIELENVVISDATANSLNTKTTNGRISIAGPNALGVEISGRVMTPTGQGLRNATVTIRDANGQSRTATTGTFGFYRFEGLTPGDQYTVTISSRTYRFTPRRLQAADNLTGIDFTAKE